MIAYIAYFAYSAKFTKSLRKVCAVLTIYTLRIVRYDKGTTKKATDQGKEENTMRKIKITAENKKHFDSLIRDFRNNGFMLVTYGRRLAELETETEFVIIEY